VLHRGGIENALQFRHSRDELRLKHPRLAKTNALLHDRHRGADTADHHIFRTDRLTDRIEFGAIHGAREEEAIDSCGSGVRPNGLEVPIHHSFTLPKSNVRVCRQVGREPHRRHRVEVNSRVRDSAREEKVGAFGQDRCFPCTHRAGEEEDTRSDHGAMLLARWPSCIAPLKTVTFPRCANSSSRRKGTTTWGRERFERIMRGASRSVVAVDEEGIVGFARALFDGASNGYISTVAVAKDRQRQGIGRELVTRLMAHAPAEEITWVLRSARESRAFWERMGFRASETAMEIVRSK
jgi:GNAT superfamily N-acetyltransferase